jgi:hypothetical protein
MKPIVVVVVALTFIFALDALYNNNSDVQESFISSRIRPWTRHMRQLSNHHYSVWTRHFSNLLRKMNIL